MDKKLIFGICVVLATTILISSTIILDDSKSGQVPHYTEFEGEVFTENWCTENVVCYGLEENGQKIILDCHDMVMHGCDGPDKLDDYIDDVLPPCTSDRTACFNPENNMCDPSGWDCGDAKENFDLINNPAVKNCVPKKEGDVYPTMPYRNSTHSFDPGVCEWNLKTHDYEIEYEGGTYGNQYEIVGATVNEITYDPEANSLSISLNESKNGYIHIVIPLELFNARHVDLEPSTPFTLIDGEEVAYEQLSPNQLKINFEKGDKLIEIIGTHQI